MSNQQFDLFDQPGAKGSGERQTDLEAQIAYEDSLLAKISSGDKAGEKEWIKQAKSGQIMRIM